MIRFLLYSLCQSKNYIIQQLTEINLPQKINRFLELKDKTPIWDEVIENYDPSRELIREQSYELDRTLVELK
jgi:hypothetical protein